MSRAWGEAAWTARDLTKVWLLVDHHGAIHGDFETEDEAIAHREALGATGSECWVVPAERIEEETC